jgi:hypothetical protein
MLIETEAGKVRTRRGSAEHPDAVLTGRPGLILGLLSGRFDLPEARKRGLEFKGSQKALHRVVGSWGL